MVGDRRRSTIARQRLKNSCPPAATAAERAAGVGAMKEEVGSALQGLLTPSALQEIRQVPGHVRQRAETAPSTAGEQPPSIGQQGDGPVGREAAGRRCVRGLAATHGQVACGVCGHGRGQDHRRVAVRTPPDGYGDLPQLLRTGVAEARTGARGLTTDSGVTPAGRCRARRRGGGTRCGGSGLDAGRASGERGRGRTARRCRARGSGRSRAAGS